MEQEIAVFKYMGFFLVIVPVILFFVFAEDSYRYPCQDPANWNAAECQRPLCEVTRTCPDHIFRDPQKLGLAPPVSQSPTEVSCAK